MSLDGALSIATSGLGNIDRHFAVISQNVANASTPGYSREIATQESMTAAGIGMGVRTNATARQVDDALQGDLLSQNAMVGGLTTRSGALSAIDTALGAVGGGADLSSLLGGLQDAFSTLQTDPSSQTQQSAVVASAQSLASGINRLAGTYTTQRQAAQDGIVSDVATLNATLGAIGGLTKQIVALKSAGQSTADLENQRDAAVQTISSILDVKTLQQDNGNLVLVTASGLTLPTGGTGKNGPFSATQATVGPNATYPASIPPITLGGVDVTCQLGGGTLGARVTLRDTTLPTDQAELDEFSQSLASRFDAQGLRLFSDASGAVPAAGGTPVQAGYVGFSTSIRVNPAVASSPALVRDGTQAVAGSTTGASAFTPNPSGGPAGFSALIGRVLSYALGSEVQAGVAQPAAATTGLGASGNLAAPYAAPATLAGFASALTAAQAQESGAASAALTTETGVQTSLAAKLNAASGVSVDLEMSQMIALQNAYGANAKVVESVQAMWTALLGMIP